MHDCFIPTTNNVLFFLFYRTTNDRLFGLMNMFISCVNIQNPLLLSLCYYRTVLNLRKNAFVELTQDHSDSSVASTGGHIYHSQCLNAWIVSKQDRNEVPNCPMCRAEITPEDCKKVKHTFSIITHRREVDFKQRKKEKETMERKQLKKQQ